MADDIIQRIGELVTERRAIWQELASTQQGISYERCDRRIMVIEASLIKLWDERRRSMSTFPAEPEVNDGKSRNSRARNRAAWHRANDDETRRRVGRRNQIHVGPADSEHIELDDDERRGLRQMSYERCDASHGSRKVM